MSVLPHIKNKNSNWRASGEVSGYTARFQSKKIAQIFNISHLAGLFGAPIT